MHFRSIRRFGESIVLLVLCGMLAVSLSAASFGPSVTKSTSSTVTTIKKNWTEFFSGSTSPKQKTALLQNGTKFTSVIDSQASSSLAKSTSVTVSKVVLTSATTAKVTYTISLDGKPVLKNQTGQAVKVAGTWKVGTASFCGLLSLEQVKTAGCPSS